MARDDAVDATAADTATPDTLTTDAAMADAATADTLTADAATPDAAMPDAAMPDVAVPDVAMPDAAMPDAAMPDTAAPDSCVSYAGQVCGEPELCGASYDCNGDCVGGAVGPDCPDCGARSCVGQSYWGDCEGGSCDVNSYCDSDGECVCAADACVEAQCYVGDIYDCVLDRYGCGTMVLAVDCPLDNCSGYPPECSWDQLCSQFQCSDDDGACVPGTSVLQCGSYGETCEACFAAGICQSASCIDGDCYYLPTSGDPCDDNRVCFNGECCVSDAGEACVYLCPPCYCSTPGWTACDGSCVPYNCFDVCASC